MLEGAPYDGIGHTPDFRALTPEEAATPADNVLNLDADDSVGEADDDNDHGLVDWRAINRRQWEQPPAGPLRDEEGNILPDMSGAATDLISVREDPWDERSPA